MVGSETTYGVNKWPATAISKYCFLPGVHFLEFIPEADIENDSPRTFLASELDVGKCYELVLTSYSGLYRYRVGDVVQILDPCSFEMVYRRGSLLNIFNEMTTEAHISSALSMTLREMAVSEDHLVDWTSMIQTSASISPHYVIFLEVRGVSELVRCTEWAGLFSITFDKNLKVCQPIYETKRRGNKVGPLQLSWLDEGAFLALEQFSCSRHTHTLEHGESAETFFSPSSAHCQYKCPRVIKTAEQRCVLNDYATGTLGLDRVSKDTHTKLQESRTLLPDY
jgi:GH3 auxin-responsive promoter